MQEDTNRGRTRTEGKISKDQLIPRVIQDNPTGRMSGLDKIRQREQWDCFQPTQGTWTRLKTMQEGGYLCNVAKTEGETVDGGKSKLYCF